ncbi:DUF58 domain-containing protein [Xylanimonas oleitrophica]|uniref:DUF58 domain-containing protein n=1 Tax=Xylanimonas oleitrophica TaxID=2607479 RepID=A0A2W5WVU5_9MICO|nr:DUF58 domain-containing protein [Xylanimonas oleitrophica]PZR55437.1 DUF58 domain-containing protein [Xylanimonas oleitrophica]
MRDALRRVARVRPTRRGLVLVVAGGVILALGILLGLHDVVALGSAALGVVVVSWLTLGLQRLEQGRGALSVARRVRPSPVVRGQQAHTELVVSAARPTAAAYERLARLRLSEQAAHELAGREGVRARVQAHPDRIQVRYAVHPSRRGRWPLGPLLTTRSDTFGLVRTTQPLGAPTTVTVWPRTDELPVRAGLLGDVEMASTGARITSPDDSVLREYVMGDDLRRVHWPSAARTGHLMVRTDEAAGVRPVTVLLDRALLPAPGEARSVATTTDADTTGEWAVEHAASLACSFLDAGHPVRIVPTDDEPFADGGRFVTGPRTGRGALLDSTVELHGARTAPDAERTLAATARALRVSRTAGEIVVAIVPPLGAGTTRELAVLAGEAGACWALVVSADAASAEETVAALRAAGWRTATASPGVPHARAWSLLAERTP